MPTKTMREKMADEGLTSFVVSFRDESEGVMQFWAEDAGHAGEQFDDAMPHELPALIETQDEYEARTGVTLDYGRSENV